MRRLRGWKLPILADAEQLAEIRRIASEQMEIDLESGQMLRLVRVETYDGGPGYLLVVMSHLIADGVSWRILLEDLEFAYRQARAGSEVTLPASTTSFAEWAHRLQSYAQSETCADRGELLDRTAP